MKRVMTLVGGIVGVVVDAIYSVLMIIGVTAILELVGGAQGAMTLIVAAVFEIIVGIVALVLNAISICTFKYSHEKFAKKRPVVITAIVFNFILALLMIFSLATDFNISILLIMLASLASAILFIVDLGLEKKRVKNVAVESTEPTLKAE